MKVSVFVTTYNHEKFIATSLDSILMQQTKFDYELVIAEDCSTDNTRAMVIDYQTRFPDKVRLLLSEQNVGFTQNFAQLFSSCRGEYIALSSGDDYWLDPLKLQKQVEFLDQHPEYSTHFHSVIAAHPDGQTELYRPPQNKPVYTLQDLMKGNFIYCCAVMFRRASLGEPPAFYYQVVGVVDYLVHMLNALHGDIAYIDDPMAAYRIHGNNMWAAGDTSWHRKEELSMLEAFDKMFNHRYANAIQFTRRYYQTAQEFVVKGNTVQARRYAFKCLKTFEPDQGVSRLRAAALLLGCYMPGFYKGVLRQWRHFRKSARKQIVAAR